MCSIFKWFYDEFTPLEEAARQGDLITLSMLIEYGYSCDIGKALIQARMFDRIDIIQYLEQYQ